MHTPNPIESPIIGIEPPGINADETPIDDIPCGCTAIVPTGSRMMFMVFAAASMLVGCGILLGLYKLAEAMNWL